MTATESPSESLEVPGEPGVYWCARHKNVKTRLRCGRCETPICPKCTVMGPTGARCRDCASNRSAHIYQVKPWQFAATFIASAALCAIGAILVRYIGLMLVFFAPVIGTFVGKAIIWATRGKRGLPLASVATAGAFIGALLTLIPSFKALQRAMDFASATGASSAYINMAAGNALMMQGIYTLVFFALLVSAIWYWLR